MPSKMEIKVMRQRYQYEDNGREFEEEPDKFSDREIVLYRTERKIIQNIIIFCSHTISFRNHDPKPKLLKEKINSQNYPYTEEDMNERKRERERAKKKCMG
jgi:hypothetical protein